jgi:hypothetical protein
MLLEHPFLGGLRAKNKRVPDLRVENDLLTQIDSLMQTAPYRAKVLDDYHDPVEMQMEAVHDYHGPWMAAMYPVVVDRKPTDWVVIVQEKKHAALAPVYDLRRQLVAQAVVAAVAVILAVLAAWAFAALLLHGHTRSKFVNALRRRMGLTGARGTASAMTSGGRTARQPGKTATSRSTGRERGAKQPRQSE